MDSTQTTNKHPNILMTTSKKQKQQHNTNTSYHTTRIRKLKEHEFKSMGCLPRSACLTSLARRTSFLPREA